MNVLLITLSFILGGFNLNSDVVVKDYSGEWEYSVDTPDGTVTGIIVLKSTVSGYEAHLESEGAQIPASEVTVDGDKMSFNINVQGFDVTISGTFDGDTYNAMASVEGMELPFVATKK